ncbi:bifunctional coenzyme A synthase-like [Xenia sp. Carnegie-2017]|uniref:bifunctional coenzyme A synthase-like n=1 Tax=Xenia sp. Carnegie-2017 TaxID=2897299 RepID=UPI001F0414FB|nr:bifunctional coenzyme A synthase-like [Xenia sp. Carnegie-2017]
MAQTGVLILRPYRNEIGRLFQSLKACSHYVQRVLYVDFNCISLFEPDGSVEGTLCRQEVYSVMEMVYKSQAKELEKLDIRFLLESRRSTSSASATCERRTFSHNLDVGLLYTSYQNQINVEMLCNRYGFRNIDSLQFLDDNMYSNAGLTDELLEQDKVVKEYDTVAVGGTFDRIHNGHRLLLSTSCLLAKSKIVVGVSNDFLLVNKTLLELIEPLDLRMKNVTEFIEDIKPGLVKDIVPLCDPAGPTKTDATIDCLVVSDETRNGGQAVNILRKDANLPEMELFSIDLVSNEDVQSSNASKLSSTARRYNDLGVLVRPPKRSSSHSGVYVIGLTGGIASGKSSIAKRLEKLGAQVLSADLVGHSVYEPGTEAFNEIIDEFGVSILNKDGFIDRKKLGSIVFDDSLKLQKLNAIVWPAIMEKIKIWIEEISKKGDQVCVIEAALLLEAGWDEVVDEIWVCIIPEVEAIKRLGDRNGLSIDEAKKRLSNQITNKDRVSQANIVLSTQWAPEYTQKQVEKAWKGLHKRIKVS